MPSFDKRRIYPDNIDVLSIVSSNATQSDLPGAGRMLEKLYGNLGAKLEATLNNLVNKNRKGPNELARRIRDRDWRMSEEDVRQRKDMKKLISYTKLVFIRILCLTGSLTTLAGQKRN